MNSSPLCPNCRTPMVEISRLIKWSSDADEWSDFPEGEADWDVSLGLAAEEEKIYECPHCGYREYEP